MDVELDKVFKNWQNEEIKYKAIQIKVKETQIKEKMIMILYFVTLQYLCNKYKIKTQDEYNQLVILHFHKFMFMIMMVISI